MPRRGRSRSAARGRTGTAAGRRRGVEMPRGRDFDSSSSSNWAGVGRWSGRAVMGALGGGWLATTRLIGAGRKLEPGHLLEGSLHRAGHEHLGHLHGDDARRPRRTCLRGRSAETGLPGSQATRRSARAPSPPWSNSPMNSSSSPGNVAAGPTVSSRRATWPSARRGRPLVVEEVGQGMVGQLEPGARGSCAPGRRRSLSSSGPA